MKIANEIDYGVMSQKNKIEQEAIFTLEEDKMKNQEKKNGFSEEEVENSIAELNDTIDALQKDLRFQVHEKSNRMMVEIVNLKNNEVIKELPPKAMLDMLGRIKEMVGLLIDEKI